MFKIHMIDASEMMLIDHEKITESTTTTLSKEDSAAELSEMMACLKKKW